MKSRALALSLIIGGLLAVGSLDLAWAGVGGGIASLVIRGFFGRLLLTGMVFLFFPVVLYGYLKEHIAERATLQDLCRLGLVSNAFAWQDLRARIEESFLAIHKAWSGQDLSLASAFMTPWFWQNQQRNYIDRWKAEGLENICIVKAVESVKPIFVAFRHGDSRCDGSKIVVAISAETEDYLVHQDSSLVWRGKRGYGLHDTLWTFVLKDEQWLVSNIETTEQWLTYRKLSNEIPAVLPVPARQPKKSD